MSKNVNGIPVIAAEKPLICFECGKIAEVRPYGENGSEVCFQCAMKNPRQTERMMRKHLFGEEVPNAD